MYHVILVSAMAAAFLPTLAFAQDAPQPKYPPGFDCAQLPAGDEREACQQSELGPTKDGDPNDGRSITGAGPETPGSVSPPTFPDEPGNENRDSGPGSSGGAGGVGN
jgi:hypothetical protein